VGYGAALVVAAVTGIYGLVSPPFAGWVWLLLIPLLVLLLALRAHLRTRLSRLTVDEHTLRYEAGLVSKTTRTVEIGKIQDVRVDQTLSQRLLATGNLTLETAGGGSRLTMPDVDAPHQVAGAILKLSAPGGAKGQSAQ
jgi:uncharacterized membrane protein YdbT with pleckstrin-like domain